ncbi:hypothetical protein P154DRAFT_524611 [Amniculicola lignicola CBS 123094]|uniref:Uncharacterized protein n=1 Tax=Amniculicola lignicola CBS 123094 TaxID=1392246 RepID=A0A6A5W743_9PLEO|nr:hypothetical protein P154DRAFT_524611 [Amniculicola lignicola CBS 123094]
MAPQPNSTPAKNNRRQPATGRRQRTPIVNSTWRTGTRSSARLQHIQLPPIPPAPISQPAGTKRKRSQDSEAEAEAEGLEGVRPSKQLRELPPSKHKLFEENLQKDLKVEANEQELPPPGYRLSEKNLQILNGEDMDPTANNAPALKRTSSRRSIAPSEAGTERTQRSSNTTAAYRHKNLAAVEIHMHAEPPDYIQTAIDRIIDAKVSEKRRSELRVIAQKLCDGCLKNVKAQAGEDDFIDPLHIALKDLGFENLCTHEKADWRGELKPVASQQSHFSSSFMSSVQQLEVNDVSAPPRKRQQQYAGEPYMSPESSTTNATHTPTNDSPESSTMPAPTPPGSLIKTPRPDISMGIQLTALTSALSLRGLNKVKARTFLTWLQHEMVQRELDGPLEPMLLPVPAPRALDLAFPFAVVEGKAYSTGKQIFEAENQASVSGACGLKIQLDLDNLVNRSAKGSDASPTTSNTEPPLFFTTCTQGPIHELWAHWTVVEDGVRIFGSKLLDSCNALLLRQGEGFIVELNNIVVWGLGSFMKSVVERLGMVAEKAKVK